LNKYDRKVSFLASAANVEMIFVCSRFQTLGAAHPNETIHHASARAGHLPIGNGNLFEIRKINAGFNPNPSKSPSQVTPTIDKLIRPERATFGRDCWLHLVNSPLINILTGAWLVGDPH
jgi:hypothetical protein